MAIDHSHFFLVFIPQATKYSCTVTQHANWFLFLSPTNHCNNFINRKNAMEPFTSITKKKKQKNTPSDSFSINGMLVLYVLFSNGKHKYLFVSSKNISLHIWWAAHEQKFTSLYLSIKTIYLYIQLACLIYFSWKHLMCGFDGILFEWEYINSSIPLTQN